MTVKGNEANLSFKTSIFMLKECNDWIGFYLIIAQSNSES